MAHEFVIEQLDRLVLASVQVVNVMHLVIQLLLLMLLLLGLLLNIGVYQTVCVRKGLIVVLVDNCARCRVQQLNQIVLVVVHLALWLKALVIVKTVIVKLLI
jgi:hypothetical protein